MSTGTRCTQLVLRLPQALAQCRCGRGAEAEAQGGARRRKAAAAAAAEWLEAVEAVAAEAAVAAMQAFSAEQPLPQQPVPVFPGYNFSPPHARSSLLHTLQTQYVAPLLTALKLRQRLHAAV